MHYYTSSFRIEHPVRAGRGTIMAAALVCFITLVQFQYIANRSVQKDVVAYLDTFEDQTLRENLGPDSIQIDLDGLSAAETSTDNLASVPVLAARGPSPSRDKHDASCAPQVHGLGTKLMNSAPMKKIFGAVRQAPDRAKYLAKGISIRGRNVARSVSQSGAGKKVLDCIKTRCPSINTSPSRTGQSLSPRRRPSASGGSGRFAKPERPAQHSGSEFPVSQRPWDSAMAPSRPISSATGNSRGGRGDTGDQKWVIDASEAKRKYGGKASGQGLNPQPTSGEILRSDEAVQKYGRANLSAGETNSAFAEMDRQLRKERGGTNQV